MTARRTYALSRGPRAIAVAAPWHRRGADGPAPTPAPRGSSASRGEIPPPGLRHGRGIFVADRAHGDDVFGEASNATGTTPARWNGPYALSTACTRAVVAATGRSPGDRRPAPSPARLRGARVAPALRLRPRSRPASPSDPSGPSPRRPPDDVATRRRPGRTPPGTPTDVLRRGTSPAGQHLEMCGRGPGRYQHPRPQDLGAPTQVEVLPHGEDLGIESPQLGEQVEADARAHPPGREDVTHGVVLSVVDLARPPCRSTTAPPLSTAMPTCSSLEGSSQLPVWAPPRRRWSGTTPPP